MVRKKSKLSWFIAQFSTSRGIVYVMALIIVVLAVLELTNLTNFFLKDKASSGIIPTSTASEQPSSSDDQSNSSTSPDTTGSSQSPKQETPSAPPPAGAAPVTPYGNFVSNHRPSLDGNPAPSSVSSVCNTSPGATCHIEFTNQDGVVKKLPAQKTDTAGATYWSWDVNQAGFTTGTWQIKAVATLNGQSATAKDVQNLEVGP